MDTTKAFSNSENDLTDSAGAQQDFFELLERAQSSRLDDQRCVLPAYFEQVNKSTKNSNTKYS